MNTETGAGLEDANSYITLAYADTYHATFGNTAWPATPDVNTDPAGYATITALKELALIRATRAVDTLFGDDFKGYPLVSTQALLFPRTAFYINRTQVVQAGTLPRALKDAVAEVALKDVNGENINPDVAAAAVTGSETVKVADVEVSTTFNDTPTTAKLDGFLLIERLLEPLLEDEDGDDIVRIAL